MTADLSTKTPREIDTELAALHGDKARAESGRASALLRIHDALGEQPHCVGRTRREWPTSSADAIAKAREIADASAAPSYTRGPWTANPRGAFDALAVLDAADKRLSEIRDAIKVFDAEYARRPWSRFFIVRNNNGHIHSSMSCKTCYTTTDFGWLPELSGKSEADAVFDHGTILCSVCFPSAPVEWTMGNVKPAGCPGKMVPDTYKRVGMKLYAKCDECGSREIVNANGSLRKHKPKG